MLTRDDAERLVREHLAGQEALVHHSLQSEALLRALARRLGHDEDLWGLAGLVHDLDYAATADDPERHGLTAAEMLEGLAPAEVVYAVKAHNGERNGTQPAAPLDFALRCGETVTGMVTAAALVRPTGITGMQAKSLKKKMKDKAFARSVSREAICECDKLGLDLSEFLALAIAAVEAVAGCTGVPCDQSSGGASGKEAS